MEKSNKFKKSERIKRLLEEFDKLPQEDQESESEAWLDAAIKIADEND